MEIKRAGSQPSATGNPEWFTGRVRIDPLCQALAPARAGAGIVTFEHIRSHAARAATTAGRIHGSTSRWLAVGMIA